MAIFRVIRISIQNTPSGCCSWCQELGLVSEFLFKPLPSSGTIFPFFPTPILSFIHFYNKYYQPRIGRTDVEAETPIFWPPDVKSWLIWKDLDAGKDWGQIDRGWDGWMASPTQWTWVWAKSRSWWWTGRPGVLWFMGSQRVRHEWVTELNWALLKLPPEYQQNLVLSLHVYCSLPPGWGCAYLWFDFCVSIATGLLPLTWFLLKSGIRCNQSFLLKRCWCSQGRSLCGL